MTADVRPIRPGVDIAAPAPVQVKVCRAVITVYSGDPADHETTSTQITLDLVDRWQGNTEVATASLMAQFERMHPGRYVIVAVGYIYDEVQ